MNTKPLAMTLGIGLSAIVYRLLRKEWRSRNRAAERAFTHDEIATWDGEGGNVPNRSITGPAARHID